jgi:hypothetical protein
MTATRKRLSGRRLQKLRMLVLARDNWRCRYCGAWADEIDHVQRVRDGGSDDLSNLVAACSACNAARELSPRMLERAARFFSGTATETRPVSAEYLPESGGIGALTGDWTRKR